MCNTFPVLFSHLYFVNQYQLVKIKFMDPEKNAEPAVFKIIGDWGVQSKSLKAKFMHLTDGDLQFEVGKENEMLKRMESRLYITRDEVITIIRSNEAEQN